MAAATALPGSASPTRELGKLGLLALRDGCWEGKQVVPAEYLKQAMRKQVAAGGPESAEHGERGYGFLFWITPEGIPYMAGQGGQYVVIDAAHDIVAVTTARGDAAGSRLHRAVQAGLDRGDRGPPCSCRYGAVA